MQGGLYSVRGSVTQPKQALQSILNIERECSLPKEPQVRFLSLQSNSYIRLDYQIIELAMHIDYIKKSFVE